MGLDKPKDSGGSGGSGVTADDLWGASVRAQTQQEDDNLDQNLEERRRRREAAAAAANGALGGFGQFDPTSAEDDGTPAAFRTGVMGSSAPRARRWW